MLLALTVLVIAIALAWVLAFVGAPLVVWLGAYAAGWLLLLVTGLLGPVSATLLAIPLAVLLLLTIVPLRRAAITRAAMGWFRKVLPEMSATEREAIEAGEPWWEAEMFRGRPDWKKLMDFQYTALTPAERSFLDNEVETVCAMVDDWKVEFEDKDLPQPVWDYLREKRFFAMLISTEYGGLGFSALAQSSVVTKLASRSNALAVTVMVPNSLGPGELLLKYGTDAQKKRWLPGLADGSEIPCFGLTGPEVGSDATAMPDTGVVCWGEHEGERVLGLRLNFSKRWITLAPVATVIGLAFKLSDPDGLIEGGRKDYGITCALVPASHPGIQIGRRHYPGSAFMNGPIKGEDVFIPLDWIIGGMPMAGHGWRMLVECLSAGRGISLPAMSAAAGQAMYRSVGAYARIRRQFRVPVGRFEGVQEATGRIAGYAYTLEAMRVMTASAVDHCIPSVVTTIAKYHMTEMMRKVLTDGMDVLSGRGVQYGPRNPIATPYRAVPIAITVEGANILGRSLMIFGQGAIRCHGYVLDEMAAAHAGDLDRFDRLLFAHLGSSINRAVRAFTFGLFGSGLATSPVNGPSARYFRELERMSASLAFAADIAMGTLGGDLKRRERLSARLGDVLSQLYIGSCALRFFHANGERPEDLPHLRWAMDNCLNEIGVAFEGVIRNLPMRPAAALLRLVVFPTGNPYRPVSDRDNAAIADAMLEQTDFRERISHLAYRARDAADPHAQLEHAFQLCLRAEPAYEVFLKASAKGQLAGANTREQLEDAVAKGLLDRRQADLVAEYDAARYEALLTDDFSKAYLRGEFDAEDAMTKVGDPEARPKNELAAAPESEDAGGPKTPPDKTRDLDQQARRAR
ncbi:acyl-CoA dehydrogenase [Coralloluteibacterium stylophorae]|uniref:Acyl-coenzyme A dehydrogenase n=1 Tax=Coralloluteibacterium stylophorae TaxID=1776034 RepID=A0A8J8AZV0_9GAMM|nr:acyl-CoA dehydrogenase [Coralloluteibacterium stylophorae]MBS7458636.1 acyl-CoA dehydrogenase [Coralloluteibacterium stylophorae]